MFKSILLNIEKLIIKIGWRKKSNAGIDMKYCTDVHFKEVKTTGYETGVKAEDVHRWEVEDTDINKK